MLLKKIYIYSLFFCATHAAWSASKITVIIPTYNNEQYCIDNIKSVTDQCYDNFNVIVINDKSTDNTLIKLKNYIKEKNLTDIVTLIDNSERKGSLRNIYEIVHSLPDETVVALLDGDDTLGFNEDGSSDTTVLACISNMYADKDVWMTYGQYINSNDKTLGLCCHIPDWVYEGNCFRKFCFVSSHLKTFYAGLFKKINVDDLKYEGEFFKAAGDLAFMFPLLEMSAKGHFRFVEKILYYYNCDNPLSDFRVNRDDQLNAEKEIKSRKPYEPLTELPFLKSKGSL